MDTFQHPTHFRGHLNPLETTITIHGQYDPYVLADTCARLLCLCGNDTFSIYLSDYPSVQCQCANCHAEFLVYDVREYPAASVDPRANGRFTLWESPNSLGPYQVLVSIRIQTTTRCQ